MLRFELLLHFEKLVCFICLISDMLSYTKFYPFNTRLYRFCFRFFLFQLVFFTFVSLFFLRLFRFFLFQLEFFQLILHSPFSLDFSFIIAAVFLCFFIALTALNYLF